MSRPSPEAVEPRRQMTDRERFETLVLPRLRTPEDRVRADELLTGKCLGFDCPCDLPGTLHRQNTQYVDELRNWTCLCPEHDEMNDEYWHDRWSEYYADVMPLTTKDGDLL